MKRQVTGPAIMIYQGEGKALKPFARMNLKRDFHKITIPRECKALGRRVFAGALRDLSIRGEREHGTNAIKPEGLGGTISITIGSDYEMQFRVDGFKGYKQVVVELNPDCELFPGNAVIRKSTSLDENGSSTTTTFGTAWVRECESIEVYLSK